MARDRHLHARARWPRSAVPAHGEGREVGGVARRPPAHVLARREAVQAVVGLLGDTQRPDLLPIHHERPRLRAVPPRREPQRGRVLHHLHEPDPRVERQCGRRHRPDRPRVRRRTGPERQQHREHLPYRLHARPPSHYFALPSNGLRPVNAERAEAWRHGEESTERNLEVGIRTFSFAFDLPVERRTPHTGLCRRGVCVPREARRWSVSIRVPRVPHPLRASMSPRAPR